VAGSTNTVFSLRTISGVREILAVINEEYKQQIADEPEFSDAERDQVDRIRAERQAERAALTAAEHKANDEKAADAIMKSAEVLLKQGKRDGYRSTLRRLSEKYPETPAGKKAKTLLK
jgi:hypothetical protein